jgi:WD40 repeat protein
MLNAVAFSPDGRSIASGGPDGIVHLRGVETFAADAGLARKDGEPADRDFIEPRSHVHGLAFTPDGTRLVVGTSTDAWARISVYRVADGHRLRSIDKVHGPLDAMVNGNPVHLAVTPDGRRILSTGVTDRPAKPGETTRPVTSEIRIWDVETGERIREWRDEEHHWLANAVLSRDGRFVVAPGRDSLRIVDAVTSQPDRTIALPGGEQAVLALSPDGTILAASVSNAIYLFDVQTGRRRLQDDSMPAREWRAAAWSPAGDRIVTAHDDGIVRVWDAATGRPIWYKPLAAGPGGPSALTSRPSPSRPTRVAWWWRATASTGWKIARESWPSSTRPTARSSARSGARVSARRPSPPTAAWSSPSSRILPAMT